LAQLFQTALKLLKIQYGLIQNCYNLKMSF